MTKNPRIAVDLDGVVYDWEGTVRYLIAKHWDISLPVSTSWDSIEQSVSPVVWRWLWTDGIDLGLFRYGHHLKGSVDGLRELAQIGTLEVVTHRPRSALQDTLRFIANLPDVFSGVHFLTEQQPKSSVGCDVYLDDAAHVIKQVTSAGAMAVIFSQPWNQDLPVAIARRAKNWDAVPNAVERQSRIVTREKGLSL